MRSTPPVGITSLDISRTTPNETTRSVGVRAAEPGRSSSRVRRCSGERVSGAARRDLADDERRLAAAKKALENAAQEVEATTKTSRRVSGFLTGKSRGYKREAELAERFCGDVRPLVPFLNSFGQGTRISTGEIFDSVCCR